jgi:hypothetical protein
VWQTDYDASVGRCPSAPAALVATDQQCLLVGNAVLASEDGLSWQRIADSAMDPDLSAGTPIAAAVADPGVVAVGSDNKAWYSTDGTDWTLADVPQAPGEPPQLARPLDRTQTQGAVEMLGVAVSGRNLVASGVSTWLHDDNSATFVPVLWASNDGLSWASVPVPQSTRYATVARGPNGFVLEESSDVWLSPKRGHVSTSPTKPSGRLVGRGFTTTMDGGSRCTCGRSLQGLPGTSPSGPTASACSIAHPQTW